MKRRYCQMAKWSEIISKGASFGFHEEKSTTFWCDTRLQRSRAQRVLRLDDDFGDRSPERNESYGWTMTSGIGIQSVTGLTIRRRNEEV